MAASSSMLSLFVLIFITQAYSQTPYEQNTQAFYPFIHRPPPNVPPPPPDVPPPPPKALSSLPRISTGVVVAVTFTGTLGLAGALFVLFLWCCRFGRNGVASLASDEEEKKVLPLNDVFLRMNWDLKGVIVDENGVDMVYWRISESGSGLRFKKQIYRSLDEDHRTTAICPESLPSNNQELHLLRSMSSTSDSALWVDTDRKMVEMRHSHLRFGNRPAPAPAPPPPQSLPADIQVVPRRVTSGLAPPSPPIKPPAPPPPRPTQSLPAPAAPPPPSTVKRPTLPPPPPIKPPTPPPPRPTQSSPAAAAPPPPLPPSKRPAPPVVPRSRTADASASSSSPTPRNRDAEIKLKPLHWEKVNPNPDYSMVWDNVVKGSFSFDGDLMELLFGYTATNTINTDSSSTPSQVKTSLPSQIFILDPRKSQNTAIVLKSLGATRREIMDSLIEGQGLQADTIEKLAKIAPAQEETSQLLAFDGDPTKLADAESFLYHLLKSVPSAFIRSKAMLFKATYDSEVSHIRESLQSLESACKELRTRGLFLKLLEAVLKTGNRLNAGTSRGNAQAFNLSSLKKLSDVKSSDGKTTLLQFVVQEVVRAEGKRCLMNNRQKNLQNEDTEREYMIHGLPIVGGLSSEFSNVKKAATLENDALVKTISALGTQISEIGKMVDKCGSEGGFANRMNHFLESSELEMQVLTEEHIRVMEFVKRTTNYYHAGSSKDYEKNPFQLFVIIRDFLVMVDLACIEITRNLPKRKTVSSLANSSSPGVSQKIPRFPKLPSDIMPATTESSFSVSD